MTHVHIWIHMIKGPPIAPVIHPPLIPPPLPGTGTRAQTGTTTTTSSMNRMAFLPPVISQSVGMSQLRGGHVSQNQFQIQSHAASINVLRNAREVTQAQLRYV